LEGLVKVAGQGGGAIVGAIASALLGAASGKIGGKSQGGKKFTALDVKRVYFGSKEPLNIVLWFQSPSSDVMNVDTAIRLAA
jgi:hypothetical protein